FIDIGEVQSRVDALGVQVQRHGDQADVTGALAVAEQAAFNTVGAGHDGQLGGCHRSAPIVMRMHADDYAVALLHVIVEPFDLVGVHVRGGRLDGCRQIENNLV